MRNLYLCLLALLFVSFQSTLSAEGFYKWKDTRGNIQYGDTPSPKTKAEKVKMPAITVIDNYAQQWKPMNFDTPSTNEATQAKGVSKQVSSGYKKFEFIAPKANQSIRANDGDVSAMISIKPPLKKGHKIAFFLDGKEVSKSTARSRNFSDLARGTHMVSAKVVDQNGRSIKNSSVSFNVMRFSKLFKKKPITN